MGTRYNEVGGGPAVGVANDWGRFLQSILYPTGGPGGVAGGGGVSGILSDLLAPSAGQTGGLLQTQIQRELDRQSRELRSRFSSIGGGYGSGAAQAERQFRAQTATDVPLSVANLQLQAIAPLLGYVSQFAQRGTSQRGVVAEQNPFIQGLSAIAPAIGGFLGGPAGASLFGSNTPAPIGNIGSQTRLPTDMISPALPNYLRPMSFPTYPWSN